MQIRSLRVPALLSCGLLMLGVLGTPPAAAEMNLDVDKLSSNGLEVRKLSSKLSTGGLFGAMLIVGELAKQKKDFDKCAAAGAAFRTEFTWKDGKTTNAKVTASSDAKANDCVIMALKKTKAAVVGTCTAIVLTGNQAKAEAAAATLLKE